MQTPNKVLIVFNCDTQEGIHVNFERPVTPYQVHKVARKLSGLPKLNRAAYELVAMTGTHILMFRPGSSKPVFSRTLTYPEPILKEDLSVSESPMVRELVTLVEDFIGLGSAPVTRMDFKMMFVSEDAALKFAEGKV